MSIVLETNQLTKHYGRIQALNDLNLSVDNGQVFGILGPNGSGKTTTLGMILGVIKPTSGGYTWFGQGNQYYLRKRIGAILEHPIFYPFLSAVENMKVTAHIKNIDDPPIDELLKKVGLFERRNDPFKTYSLGMKQRLAIACALVADPEILIFDEPTNGLDPQGIADIRGLIMDIAQTGKTILLASHLLDEVQKVCTNFAVLRSGNKIFQGSVEEVLNQKQRIEVWSDNEEQLRSALQDLRQIKNIKQEKNMLVCELNEALPAGKLNSYLFERGIVASHLANVRSSLEEQFLSILSEND